MANMLTEKQKLELVAALKAKGYNEIDAKNVAYGDPETAWARYDEYCVSDNYRVQNFFTKYAGKYVDYDGQYGNQCVDLIRQYCKEVLKINAYTLPPVEGAIEMFDNFGRTDKFTKIFNLPWNKPRLGDIVYFRIGQYGHVAIATDKSGIWTCATFDQNFPTGSKCQFVNHSYIKDRVVGWLRPKDLKIK